MPKQKLSLIVLMTSLLIAAACSRSDVRDLTREDGTIPNDSIVKSVEFLYLHDDEQTMLGAYHPWILSTAGGMSSTTAIAPKSSCTMPKAVL